MARGVDLLLQHCAAFDERPSARLRLGAQLGEPLASLLVYALAQRRGGRRGSSAPYSLTYRKIRPVATIATTNAVPSATPIASSPRNT
jgi:hypothetical protein